MYIDLWTHILSGASMISSTNSPYTCSAYCNQQSFPYFGIEYCKYCSHNLLHKFQHWPFPHMACLGGLFTNVWQYLEDTYLLNHTKCINDCYNSHDYFICFTHTDVFIYESGMFCWLFLVYLIWFLENFLLYEFTLSMRCLLQILPLLWSGALFVIVHPMAF